MPSFQITQEMTRRSFTPSIVSRSGETTGTNPGDGGRMGPDFVFGICESPISPELQKNGSPSSALNHSPLQPSASQTSETGVRTHSAGVWLCLPSLLFFPLGALKIFCAGRPFAGLRQPGGGKGGQLGG